MVEVTESDTMAAKALARALYCIDDDPKNIKDTLANAFATHRIEAAKAERDRIVAWLRDQDGHGEWYEAADALEKQP